MQKKILFNPHDIRVIRINNKKLSDYTYQEAQPKKTILFGLWTLEYARSAGWGNRWVLYESVEKLLDANKPRLTLIDNQVWYKPYVVFEFKAYKYPETVYFSSIEEIDEFVNNIIDKYGLHLEVLHEE